MADINLGKIKPIYKGEHSNTTIYKELDIVIKDGSSYIVLKEGSGEITDTTLFGLLSKKGNSFQPTMKGLKNAMPELNTINKGDSYLAIDEGKIYFKLDTTWSDGFSISGSNIDLNELTSKIDLVEQKNISQNTEINKIRTEADTKYLGKSEKAVDSQKLIGLTPHSGVASNSIVVRDNNADINARLFRSNYAQDNINTNSTLVFRNNQSDNYLRFATKESIKQYLKDLGVGGNKMFIKPDDNLLTSILVNNNDHSNGFYCVHPGVYRFKVKVKEFRNYNPNIYMTTTGQQLQGRLTYFNIRSFPRDNLSRTIYIKQRLNSNPYFVPKINHIIDTVDTVCSTGDFIIFVLNFNSTMKGSSYITFQIDICGSTIETFSNSSVGFKANLK